MVDAARASSSRRRRCSAHEAPGQAVMRRAFAGLGLEPFDVPLDAGGARGHPGAARRSAGTSRARSTCSPTGCRAGDGGGRSLILNGHIDVVSPEPVALWAGDPFAARRDGEWLYGRGAGDMKSGLVAMVGAVRRTAAARASRRAGASSCSRSSRRSARATARSPACSPATRPTPRSSPSRRRARSGPRRSACCGSRCACSARRRTRATRPSGANAIEASYRVIEALRALEAELNAVRPPLYAAYPHPINLNVGMIRGGDWPSTVAGECVTHFRLATYPGEPVAELKRAGRGDRGRGVARTGRHRIEVLYEGFQCEGYELAADAPLVTGLSAARARVTAPRRRSSPRPRRPTRAPSSSTATRRRSASGRWPRTSTASTSGSTCRRSRDRPGDRPVHRRLVRPRALSTMTTQRGRMHSCERAAPALR